MQYIGFDKTENAECSLAKLDNYSTTLMNRNAENDYYALSYICFFLSISFNI